MNSAFAKLNEMLDEFRGSRPALHDHVGSDRRSPSAGPSDIARPNPIAKVSDTAPQSPDAAPGPSTATHVPPALGPSCHDAPSDDGFVSPRGGVDQGDHVRSWSCHVSPSRTRTHQERLWDDLERTHAEISQLRDYNDYCGAHGRAPPDHYYRDLDILHSRYDQLSLALAESLQASSSGHRGLSPVIASPTDAPHRPDSSSLNRPRLSPWPGPSSQDRRRPRDASSDLPHHSRHSQERYHDRFTTNSEPRHSRRPRSRGSPSPKRLGFASRGSPSPQRMGFASRESPSPKRMGFASRGSPSPKRMGFASSAEPSHSRRPLPRESPSPKRLGRASRGSPSPERMGFASRRSPSPERMGFASRGSPSPKRMGFASRGFPSPQRMGFASRDPLHQSEWDSLQGIPPLPSDNVLLRGTLLHLDVSIHPVLRLVRPHMRDPHRGLLLPVDLHLPEKIRKLKNHLCQPRLGP